MGQRNGGGQPRQGARSAPDPGPTVIPGGAGAGAGNQQEGLGTLFAGILKDLQDLLRGEIQLAKTELREDVGAMGKGAGTLAAAALFGLTGFIFLMLGVTYLLNQWVQMWIAAGIVALAAIACGTAPAASMREVTIDIEHSSFAPGTIEVTAGTTVRFVVHNGDPIDHEFILGDEGVQIRHEDGTEKKHGAIPGEVSIPAGETRTTTYTFTGSDDLIIGCHLPRHYPYGMRAEVSVTG